MPAAPIEVTIVMPVFNERLRLERAVDAVLATEVSDNLELLIIDDGSTDGTGDILRDGSWPSAVRVIYHDHNRGKGAAIRTARMSRLHS